MSDPNARTVVRSIRLSPREDEMLGRMSGDRGWSRGELIRRLVLGAAKNEMDKSIDPAEGARRFRAKP